MTGIRRVSQLGTTGESTFVDGSIVDADINASAAIAQSKIASLTTDLSTAGGLVLVKSHVVIGSTASVSVTDAFSTIYDNYKIQWSGSSSLASGNGIEIQMGSTITGYYAVMMYAGYVAGADSVVRDNNTARWTHCAGAVLNQILLDVEIYNPFKAQVTSISGSMYTDGSNAGKKSGFLNTTTSYTGFTLFAGTGTIAGGTIRVYGYRK